MTASAAESAFQQDILRELVASGWVLGSAAGYDRERALYTEDCLAFVKKTRLPKDPATNKPEPLLTFKRGALVHFAVSQYETWMTTRLEGDDSRFLPFNKGTSAGGAGNDAAQNETRSARAPPRMIRSTCPPSS